MNKLIGILIYCLIYSLNTNAQTPTIQDCLGAIPVCQEVYTESYVPTTEGNYTNEINPNITCTDVEKSSIWYTFTVNETGNFGFIITPNNSLDDYDWALFNITGGRCGDINMNRNLLVSCNAAGGNHENEFACSGPTGATGASVYNHQYGGCGQNPPSRNMGYSTFNDVIPVSKGNTYALMISNWRQSSAGYTLDFGISEVGIFDDKAPEINQITYPKNCNDKEINIVFSEKILCNSIVDSNFKLIGPNGENYPLSPSSYNCSIGANATQNIRLTTNRGLITEGLYRLTLQSDGISDLVDNCGNAFSSGNYEYTFHLDSPGLPLLELGSDTLICEPFQLTATNEEATYLWQDGSTTDVLLAQTTDRYSVTVTNACGSLEDEIEITSLEEPVVDLGVDLLLCPNEEYLLVATNPSATYLWQDGSTNNSFKVTRSGTYAVTVSNPCGSNSDSIIVNYKEPLKLSIGLDTTVCDGQPLTLSAYNNDAAYLWQDGTTLGTLVVDTSGKYTVTVTNACESKEQSINIIFLDGPPEITLGEDQILCPKEELLLDAFSLESDYIWSDNSTNSTFNVTEVGIYSVTVTNACGTATDNIAIDYIAPINLDLEKDFRLCTPKAILQTTPHRTAIYEWAHGASEPVIEINKAGIYEVTATTICEQQTNSIEIKPCESCDLYVPTAFSPNNDGRNDYFRPYIDCEPLQFKMYILNRWGNLLYESDNIENGWSGMFNNHPVPMDVYIWKLEYTIQTNGATVYKKEAGDITIIR